MSLAMSSDLRVLRVNNDPPTCVNSEVISQYSDVSERPQTHVAAVGSVRRVRAKVGHKTRLLRKSQRADAARKWTLTCENQLNNDDDVYLLK